MEKSDDIIIFENPQKGMARHPAVGIGLLRGIDITTYPGVARLNKATVKISSTTITALPYWIKKDPNSAARYFVLDSAGQLYISTNSGGSWSTVAGETAGGGGQGMEIWKGYVVVARATRLDLYNIAGASWTNDWQANTGGADILDATQDFHSMLASIDDKLYILCGRYINSIAEVTTFDPSNSATYTYTKRAVTLPSFYNAKCITELGSSLMIGTWKGVTGALYEKVADIFPYNRSTLTLGVPIRLGENGVHAMITVGNRLYAVAGLNAKLFLTDGSSAIQVTEIPNYAIDILDTGLFLNINPGAICYHRGKILFGIDNSAAVNGNVGVWSYDPTEKQLLLENVTSSSVSTGNDGSLAEMAIGSLFSFSNDIYWIGWKDFSGTPVSGLDSKGSTSFIQTYGGVIETQLMQIGTALGNRTAQSLEFYLTKALASGQGVRFGYRKDLSSSFTTLATIDYATYGAIQSYSIPASTITNLLFIQFKIELTSTGSSTPELVRALIKPSN